MTRWHEPDGKTWAVHAELKTGTLYSAECTCGGDCSYVALKGRVNTGPVRVSRPRRAWSPRLPKVA